MADDYAGDTTTTGNIAAGGAVSGAIETGGDSDWFRITLAAGRNYEIDLAAAVGFTVPGYLNEKLIGPDGVVISSASSGAKALVITPTTAGTYYVAVSAQFGATGAYTLNATPFDDYTGDTTTTAAVAPGGTSTGTIEGAGDTDWFRIALTAGLHYEIDLTATASFSVPGYLGEKLIAPDGTIVTTAQSGSKSLLLTPTTSGTYYVAVSAQFGAVGAYTVNETPQDDYTGDTSTSGRLAVGGQTNGKLESTGDSDYFAVSLTAGQAYTFTVTAAAGFTGSSSPLYENLYNAGNVRVSSANVKTLTFTPTTSGTYYLGVSDSLGTGSYIITTTTAAAGTSTPASLPVYRFFDSRTGTQFLTSSDTERATVISTRPDLVNEGIGLRAAATTDPNGSPVYRFFDNIYGTHFFTSDLNERNTIQATRSDLTYEGVGFNEYASQQVGSIPVYRFFDSNRGTHFYTNSSSERATILSTRADLVPEGVSFYAPNT